MELITTLPADTPLRGVAAFATTAEALGFDTLHVPETTHDSLQVALLALEHTTLITVRTSMTVAFPRSPMVLAYAAWDLARFSAGRFQLGVATQVRGNIVGRFSVPWHDPAGRLADYLDALRAIFDAFAGRASLEHRGGHYTFDRLQPFFNPGPLPQAEPPLWTGGVNRRICQVAGAHADGFVSHGTNSHPRALDELVLPAIGAGVAAAGRTDGGPRIVVVPRCVTGPDEAAVTASAATARKEFAFLYSTPAYRPSLELLGRTDVGEHLSALAKRGNWADLPNALPTAVLATLVPHGTWTELPEILHAWYAGRCDGLAIPVPVELVDGAAPDRRYLDLLHLVRLIPTRGSGVFRAGPG